MKSIAIFFSRGAFGDCARHAILLALEDQNINKIKVFSNSLETLEESNWKSGGGFDRGEQLRTSPHLAKLEKIAVDISNETEMSKIDLKGIDAIITGIGNRQPFLGDRIGQKGMKNILKEMKKEGIKRICVASSMCINSNVSNDWPGMEWRSEGKIMGGLFQTICKREYKDLKGMENEVAAAASTDDVNYVVAKAVGLGEDVVPTGEYFLQKKKYDDVVGSNMAKSDVAKFLLDEALNPTLENKGVVIGADPSNEKKKS